MLLPRAVATAFDYRVPAGMRLAPGDYVRVPLRQRWVIGVVWGEAGGTVPRERLKPVAERLDVPPMAPELMRFLARAGQYTITPPGTMLSLSFRPGWLAAPPRPRPGLRATGRPPPRATAARSAVLAALAGWRGEAPAAADLARRAGVGAGVVRSLLRAGVLAAVEPAGPGEGSGAGLAPGPAAGVELNPDQAVAAEQLRAAVRAGRHATFLLQGVTGSGKTEVYLEAVRETLAAGRQALVLLPEIGTSRRTGCATRPATWPCCARRWPGSRSSWRRRHRRWRRMSTPAPDATAGCSCRSASATPFCRASRPSTSGRTRRPAAAGWPTRPSPASGRCLAAGGQALLFLNRRGYAPVLVCGACGARVQCLHCAVALVAHRSRATLLCHHCGYEEPEPASCPDCGEPGPLVACGPGVERLAEEARERFPEARLSVLSSDSVAGVGVLRRELAEVAAGRVDLVIGTQIVAKGHHFPHLRLVAVVDADLCLAGGDFRAGERTFQMIRQVTGRAGRVGGDSQALLQTADPRHPVLQAIVAGDGEVFLEQLAAERKAASAPPFSRYVAVIVSSPDADCGWRVATELARNADRVTRHGIRLWGPAVAPLSRLRDQWRWRFLAVAPRARPVQRCLAAWRDSVAIPASVRVVLDVDPQSFL